MNGQQDGHESVRVVVKLSKEERDVLKRNAKRSGYAAASSWLRLLALNPTAEPTVAPAASPTRRSAEIEVQMTKAEHAAISRRAKKRGMALSAWILALGLNPSVRIKKDRLSWPEYETARGVVVKIPSLHRDGAGAMQRLVAGGLLIRRGTGWQVTAELRRLMHAFEDDQTRRNGGVYR